MSLQNLAAEPRLPSDVAALAYQIGASLMEPVALMAKEELVAPPEAVGTMGPILTAGHIKAGEVVGLGQIAATVATG